MSGLRELYQEVILDHTKRPRNFGPLDGANRSASGFNPLCGDQIELRLTVRDGRVDDARFEGSGCAISTASASMMTEAVKGRTIEEAETLFRRFHRLLTQEEGGAAAGAGIDDAELGKLAVFEGVREFPMRVKCATLAWHTLHSALTEPRTTVTTEDTSG
jgi:nitrogen fixation NifU-like protein